MKKTLTKKQIAEYEQYCYDRDHGRLMTTEALRLLCAANDYDPESIGKHLLGLLETLEDIEEYEKAMAEYRANPVTYTMEEVQAMLEEEE